MKGERIMQYDKFIDVEEGCLAFQLKFLEKAVSLDETRYFLRNILIEPSEKAPGQFRGVATCGRRLHIVDPLDKESADYYGITPGYWRGLRSFKKNNRIWIARLNDNETKNFVFPNWEKVVPTGEGVLFKTTFLGFSIEENANTHILAKFFHDFPDATFLNFNFLEDLGVGLTWDVEWYGSQKAVKFTEDNCVAVIAAAMIG
jgi:hypothetical protein